ncbi:hypothetical protein ACQFYA_20975 [Promicromonospora sp. Marseille-Q5078]
MSEELDLTINPAPGAARWERGVAQRYWAGPRLEFGRAQWPDTLREVAAELGLGVPPLTSIVTTRSYATVAGIVCRRCGQPAAFHTRGELQKITTARRHARVNMARCVRCRTSDAPGGGRDV